MSGEEIRRRRIALNLTAQSLAAMAGVARATLRNIENGQTGDPRKEAVLLRALDAAEQGNATACECGATQLLQAERAAHRQTLSVLQAIRLLLDAVEEGR